MVRFICCPHIVSQKRRSQSRLSQRLSTPECIAQGNNPFNVWLTQDIETLIENQSQPAQKGDWEFKVPQNLEPSPIAKAAAAANSRDLKRAAGLSLPVRSDLLEEEGPVLRSKKGQRKRREG
jgi:hypothetical protein